MTCPMCAKDTNAKYRPFCSKRCADLDLGRWINGSYRVETEDVAQDWDEETTPQLRPQ